MKKLQALVSKHLAAVIVGIVALVCVAFLVAGTRSDDGSITLSGDNAKYSQAQEDALCKLKSDRDKTVSSIVGIDVPQDSTSGCEPTDLPQMGSLVYYRADVSSPGAFYGAVNGRGFNEGYGLQCVAGFKEFMFSLSGKYIAAAGGGAKGYATQQSQIEPLGFKWHNGTAGLQDGDWGIFTNGTYGHVAMYYQGRWFGQNQGAADVYAGSPFSLMNLGISPVGYYRPNIYQKATPSPSPTPAASTSNESATNSATGSNGALSADSYVVQRGDTLGGIALRNGWYGATGGLYGDTGYTQRLAEQNGIQWRGLILPGQMIQQVK